LLVVRCRLAHGSSEMLAIRSTALKNLLQLPWSGRHLPAQPPTPLGHGFSLWLPEHLPAAAQENRQTQPKHAQ
jgi:hypothetical protein